MRAVRRRMAVLAIALVFCSGISAVALAAGQDLEKKLGWISGLAGLSLVASEVEGRKYEAVYSVSGDPAGIMSRIREGLTERGWKIDEVGDAAVDDDTALTIEATAGNAFVEIALTEVGGGKTLAVNGKLK